MGSQAAESERAGARRGGWLLTRASSFRRTCMCTAQRDHFRRKVRSRFGSFVPRFTLCAPQTMALAAWKEVNLQKCTEA